ncbi:helix-turn-helix transcriptional regulator [Paractinoplanes atraurantiacus]|uniref:Regulatory protein, luxR family n=1 Tax=Paractinoplanes atraurantiacus TaxID=1036182 RepID=A0A285IFS8_9ACTN|nr:LuxR family transcriptional regulator [Actinoplanes atraurantiacus]SNY45946.1 regulatory protein, luxR family [Actinoplanes atraurantiacus]
MAGGRLHGRRRERETFDRLLRDIEAGNSRALVLRGEAGVGKTALLDYLAEQAGPGVRTTRAAGVELESEIAYSALQQLCAPLLGSLDRLPEHQREAIATAFGLSAGSPPEPLLVGLAVLGLLAESAGEQPLVAIVDDVQWLDRMSEVILTFVARRLGAESVALIFSVRSPGDERILAGLPELPVGGLPDAEARRLLDSVLPGPVDSRVRDRIVLETRGNPLALLELPKGLTPAELAFGFGGLNTAPLAGRVEETFRRRIAALPAETRKVLLAAAVEPVGDVPLLWRALQRLGIGLEAAAPAESAQLIDLNRRVRFPHPLVRSAAWRAGHADDLRDVHRALAEATDPGEDPDRRAWHRAHAVSGPDEEVAAELESSAGRALARGGRSAAAAFLERAAELTVDPGRRAGLLISAAQAHADAGSFGQVPELLAVAEMTHLDALQHARVERLRAHLALILNPGRAAGPPLLAAARRLRDLDPAAARETYLAAVGAALHAGRLDDTFLREVARAAATEAPTAGAPRSALTAQPGDAPAIEAPAAQPADAAEPAAGAAPGHGAAAGGEDAAGLLLEGITAWILDGYAAAAPALNRALDRLMEKPEPGLLWLAAPVAHEMFRHDAWDPITEQALHAARETGSLSLLPTALAFRSGILLYMGRLADAASLTDEAGALRQALGSALQPSASVTLAAYRGIQPYAGELADEVIRDAAARSEGRSLGVAGFGRAALANGLGDFETAYRAAKEAAEYPDLAVYAWTLSELVEAAARAGHAEEAAGAAERLAERTAIAGTDWALGVQAVADALTGPPGEVEGRFRRALEHFAAAGGGMQAARTHLLLGEWLRRENRRTEARGELREAYEAFTSMGAEAFAGRAARELAAAGETVRRKASETERKLTAQEEQIVRLAMAGRTNAEIGGALFLSPRTVEWHLRKVFTKLGITSRRELASALP